MKNKKPIFIFSLIWEILRYIFIFLFTVNFFILQINENNQGTFWLLSISSCSLLLPLILILLISVYNRTLIRIFYVGKILQIFPFLMLIFSELLNINIFNNYIFDELFTRNIGLVISFLFIDLLFLSLLLSYNIRKEPDINKNNINDLPDILDVPVSDLKEDE